MRTVLCIDGPLRGETYRLDRGDHFIVMTGAVEGVHQTVYHIHKAFIFGREIALGSTKSVLDGQSEFDAVDVMLTDKAKDALRPQP